MTLQIRSSTGLGEKRCTFTNMPIYRRHWRAICGFLLTKEWAKIQD